jgi:predicted O-linked N-acetylglucosamine transferase (SPINDLY family)
MLGRLIRDLWRRLAPGTANPVPAAAAEHRPAAPTAPATLDEVEAAIAAWRDTLGMRPGEREVRHQLAATLRSLSRLDEAEAVCLEGLSLEAGDTALRHTLARVRFAQGRVDEAIADVRAVLALDPAAAAVHSDLISMLNYADRVAPEEIRAECARWSDRHAQALTAQAPPPANDPTPERRLRVGYVSPGFREHPVTFFLWPALEHHDRERFEVILYSDVTHEDEYTEQLRALADGWRKIVGMDDDELARAIRDDAIDILVDLSGHTLRNRLLAFARRPAPVQVNWLGFPCTTGMTAMDYRITDPWCDPPGLTEALNSETLVRLPHVYMAWRPPLRSPAVAPLPALAAGRVTFGFFHGCYKITPRMVALWARILHGVAGSRLVVLAVDGQIAATRLRDAFAAHGIAAERLELLPLLEIDAFLATFARVDIALDPFPYHGATTTCFCLWMGLPVVALAGTTHASRADLSLLTNVGLPQFATDDPDRYVDIACGLAASLDALADLRSRLRGMMLASPVTDGRAHTRELEEAYRGMWRAWCRTRAAG